MPRFLLVVVWTLTLALVASFGVVFHQLAGTTVPLGPVPTRSAPRPGAGSDAWRVIKHLSAHHVAVIDVETGRPQDARRIAVSLVRDLEPGYAEVLIYFHRPGAPGELPARRVQWSPATGFSETIFEGLAPSADTERP